MNDGASVVTRDILRQELARYPTREELTETLRQELARYPTREELREELARYMTRDEFAMWMHTVAQQHELLVTAIADLGEATKAGFQALAAELRQEMKAGHEALFVEIGRAAQVAAEEHRRELGVLDDRYRDLPPRVTALERDLDAHARDSALHAPRPDRPRRRPPR
jgi:hypothetical protein